jgi:hypothetical protein
MSFFNWFSGKPGQADKSATNDGQKRAGQKSLPPASVPQRLSAENATPAEAGKIKRHARREQLYVAMCCLPATNSKCFRWISAAMNSSS